MSLLEVIKKAAANPDELTSESNYPIVLNPDQILLSLKPQDEASNDATLIKRVQGWTISETDSEIIDSSKNFFKKLKRKLKNPNSFGKDEFVGMLNSYLKKNSDRVGISVGAESSGEDYTRKLIEKAGFLMGREVKGLVLEACTVLELWELLKTLIVHGLVESSASSSLVYNLIEKRRSDLVCLCVKKLPNLQTSTILSIFRYFLSPPKAAHGSMLTVKNEWENQAISAYEKTGVDSIQQNTDSKEAFDLIDNGTSSTELASSITNVEYSVCKLGKGHPSYPSPECENMYMVDANLGLQPAVAVDVERKQHKVVPGAHATPRESSLHVDLNDPESFPSLGKVGVEVHSDDGYDSDVSPGDHGGTIGAKKMTGSKAGYESPFEDGELRESGLYPWEENEVEGEIERVDYDSDNRDEDDLDVAPQCMPDFGSESCENDNNGSLAETVVQSGRPNALKESSPSVSLNKISEQGKLPEGCECSTNRAGETNNKVLVSNSMRGLDIEGSSTGEVRSRETGEKLSSRIEGPSVSDGLQRKNRGSYDSYFQAGKVSPSAKYLGRDRPARPMQNESQGDDQWIDSPTGYWDSRNNCPHGHSQGTGRFRPTRNSASSAMRIDEIAYCHRRSINHSLKGDFRPAIRRISGNDDAYNVRDTISATDNSRIRRRDRYEIYQQGVNRGPRVEYRGPMFDDPASSSVRLSHDLARRERSVSPVSSRGASFSQYHWKSRSRSRTRSPLAWHIQRERNMGARRVSRSPDFRSDARMQRTRMPFQNSDFAEDGEDVFMSPSRNHFSPRHSRWVDGRNYIGPRFRQRKSPGRFLWRNPRFGSGGGSGRMMPDDRPRSTTRPGRFTELSAGTGRTHNYNGNDYERTKYSDKYEMIHQVKRSDTGGTLKRFRYDPEDCFEVHNSRNDRRDIPRSARE